MCIGISCIMIGVHEDRKVSPRLVLQIYTNYLQFMMKRIIRHSRNYERMAGTSTQMVTESKALTSGLNNILTIFITLFNIFAQYM